MGRVFAYENHNGWKDCMFLTDHELSDQERFYPEYELWSNLIQEIHSKEELLKIIAEHGITKDDEFLVDTYTKLIENYEKYSSDNYERAIVPKNNLYVGLFFFVNGNFAFTGCTLDEAEEYGDFLIYPESHFDVWDNYDTLSYVRNKRKVDYDYFPRGRVVYRKTDDLFIIYYDKCVEEELDRLTREYADYNFKTELDEHYCCHRCNRYYIK